MEPYGGSVKKKSGGGVSLTYAFTRISGWRVEQQETILFMSLITFPERCIYWSKAHKFSLSELYRWHINVRAVLFNSRCLISPSLCIRKWKWETQEEKKEGIHCYSTVHDWLEPACHSPLFVILPALWSLEIQQRSLAEGLTVLLNFQS